MWKTSAYDYAGEILSGYLVSVAKRVSSAMESIRGICLLSEDTLYKQKFRNEFIPALYREHTLEMTANCIFCSHLEKSECHSHCLKCRLGRHTDCRPLLPGLLSCDAIYPYDKDELRIPWYHTEPCDSFERLPLERYLKNFRMNPGSSPISFYETLEGLEDGLLSGEKPCHICASTDYGIYKKCYGQGDFHTFSPCRRISSELAGYYRSRNTDISGAGHPIRKEAS